MPRPRRHLATAIEHLRANGEMRMADLAALMGVAPSVLWTAVKPGVAEGLVVSRKEGQATFLSVGEGVPIEAEDESGDSVRFAVWDDGDLQLWGLEPNEDGSVTIDAAVLERIKQRIAWSPLR